MSGKNINKDVLSINIHVALTLLSSAHQDIHLEDSEKKIISCTVKSKREGSLTSTMYCKEELLIGSVGIVDVTAFGLHQK